MYCIFIIVGGIFFIWSDFSFERNLPSPVVWGLLFTQDPLRAWSRGKNKIVRLIQGEIEICPNELRWSCVSMWRWVIYDAPKMNYNVYNEVLSTLLLGKRFALERTKLWASLPPANRQASGETERYSLLLCLENFASCNKCTHPHFENSDGFWNVQFLSVAFWILFMLTLHVPLSHHLRIDTAFHTELILWALLTTFAQ